LSRARDTAEAISRHTGVRVVVTPKLRPWNLGELHGQHSSKSKPIIERGISNPDEPVKGGESFNQFRVRALGGIEDAMKEHGPVAITTHHRVERLLKAWKATGETNPSISRSEFETKGERPGSVEYMDLNHYPLSLKSSRRPGIGGLLTGEYPQRLRQGASPVGAKFPST